MWVTKLLPQNKYGGDGVRNFNLLTMLNTELKFLANILANELKTVLYPPRPNFQVYDNPR